MRRHGDDLHARHGRWDRRVSVMRRACAVDRSLLRRAGPGHARLPRQRPARSGLALRRRSSPWRAGESRCGRRARRRSPRHRAKASLSATTTCGCRSGHRLARHPQRWRRARPHSGQHARPQPALRIGERDAHRRGSRGGGDVRIDELDLALEGFARAARRTRPAPRGRRRCRRHRAPAPPPPPRRCRAPRQREQRRACRDVHAGPRDDLGDDARGRRDDRDAALDATALRDLFGLRRADTPSSDRRLFAASISGASSRRVASSSSSCACTSSGDGDLGEHLAARTPAGRWRARSGARCSRRRAPAAKPCAFRRSGRCRLPRSAARRSRFDLRITHADVLHDARIDADTVPAAASSA